MNVLKKRSKVKGATELLLGNCANTFSGVIIIKELKQHHAKL